MWVAKRELLVDGERRQVGEPIPEAETWPNRQFYVNLGWIEEMPDPAEESTDSAEAPGRFVYDFESERVGLVAKRRRRMSGIKK